MLRIQTKQSILIIVISIFFILSILLVLEITNTTNFIGKKTPEYRTGSQSSKGEVQKSKPSDTDANKSSSQSSDKQTNTQTNEKLLDPSGIFVSNHRPNLSGKPSPNQLQSICNTTPGARCQIYFQKGNVIKSLPSQLADGGGATYWTWKLQDLEIGVGIWTITAKASLNGSTKTSTDALKLEVTQ